MINTPTVFVLGAGASQTYGFPTGWELLRKVVDEFRDGEANRKHLLRLELFKEEAMDKFRMALAQSGENSVDVFLEKRNSFMEIGKAMMAYLLIRNETTDELFKHDPQNNWMRYLYTQMQGTSFEEFPTNKVGFITFNYDRSLEHFLCTALANGHGKSEGEAGSIIQKMEIIHLHGRLGYLPWQQEKSARPYDFNANQGAIEICIKEIKVVHEGIEDRKEEFARAQKLLKERGERVYFLGVGFNNVNLERLGVSSLANNRAFCTSFGMTQKEYRSAIVRFGRNIGIQQNTNCNQLVSNFVDRS